MICYQLTEVTDYYICTKCTPGVNSQRCEKTFQKYFLCRHLRGQLFLNFMLKKKRNVEKRIRGLLNNPLISIMNTVQIFVWTDCLLGFTKIKQIYKYSGILYRTVCHLYQMNYLALLLLVVRYFSNFSKKITVLFLNLVNA